MIVDARRNIDFASDFHLHEARPATTGARLVDFVAGAVARRASRLEREHAGPLHDAAVAAAIAASLGLGARLRSRAFARLARRVAHEPHDLRCAVRGFQQVDRHFAADVGAADVSGALALAEKSVKKTFAEDVAERAENIGNVVELRRAVSKPFIAVTIVLRPLFGVAENLERLGGFLKFGHGLVVAGIAIGMVLERELPIRLGNLRFRRAAFHAKNFVVIAFFRHHWTE